MATLTCKICQIGFEGRTNRNYCSADCRRKAEMEKRQIKQKERYAAWLAAMTPEERNFYNSIPTAEEICADLKPWEDELANIPTLEEFITAHTRAKKEKKQ